ncbi:MAG: hypothetical protein M0R46_02020 [Candidatus Muirbacterium halophilum]|nr:hypothetical protein [Candidatus Muirbacterium halophilum]MCK9474665.1 hypothetical protein [Candidatus Muirbacterium halophilum]
MLFYTLTLFSIFLLNKKHCKTGIFFNILALNIRPEFIFINLFIIFRDKQDFLKKFLISILSFIIILLSVSSLTTDHSQPFFNKFVLFSTVFQKYSQIEDIKKDSFLEEIYFHIDEGYDKKSVNTTVSRLKENFSIISYIINYPINYLKNFFRVIKIYFNHFHYLLFLFLLFARLKIKKIPLFILLSPFFIISLFPIETWEYRYFIYTIFFLSFFISLNIKKFTAIFIISAFYIISFFYNFNFYSSYTEFFDYVKFFKTESINNSKVICSNKWLEYFTKNNYYPNPPFTDNLNKYNNYIKDNKIDFVIIDNNVINYGNRFFNSQLIDYLNLNCKRLNQNIPYIYKVKNSEELH